MLRCRRYKLLYLLVVLSCGAYGLIMFKLGQNNILSSIGDDVHREVSDIKAVDSSTRVTKTMMIVPSLSPTTPKSKITVSASVERQLERRRRVAEVCSSRWSNRLNSSSESKQPKSIYRSDGLPHPNEFTHIRVLEDRRILYCEVPRVASTNWKRILVYLTGKANASSPAKIDHYDLHGRLSDMLIPRLWSYRPEQIQHRLNTYFKFVFVRDPLDRLRSTYNEKFARGDNSLFNDRFGRKIIAMYRSNATNESLTRGHDVEHQEFVKYLIDPRTKAAEKNYDHYYALEPHWRSFDNLCHPCDVGYDFIGHYETLDDDLIYATELMGFPEMATHFPSADSSALESRKPARAKAPTVVKNASSVRGYYDVPASDVQTLVSLFDDDYRIFGYPYPSGLTSRINST